MRTTRLHYLLPKSMFKTLLLTFITAFFLSACGIKGKLYQTPELTAAEKEAMKNVTLDTVPEEKSSTSTESTEVSADTMIDSTSDPVTQKPIEPSTAPSLDQEKES